MNTVEIQFSELVVTVFVFPAKGLWSNFAAYLFQTKLTIFSNSTCPFCREKEAFAVEKINITLIGKSKLLVLIQMVIYFQNFWNNENSKDR